MAATGAVSRGVQRARDLASRDTPLGSRRKEPRPDPVARPDRIWRQWPTPLPDPDRRPVLYERVIDGEVLAVVWDGRVR